MTLVRASQLLAVILSVFAAAACNDASTADGASGDARSAMDGASTDAGLDDSAARETTVADAADAPLDATLDSASSCDGGTLRHGLATVDAGFTLSIVIDPSSGTDQNALGRGALMFLPASVTVSNGCNRRGGWTT